MQFIAVFALFAAAMAVSYAKSRETEAFVSLSSFIAGLSQMLLLFSLFLTIFRGVKTEEFTLNTDSMILMYTLDFLSVILFLLLMNFKSRKGGLTMNKTAVAKELVQLFLPVLLLDLSIRILSKFDLGEHGYIYVRISNQYLFALLFKMLFAFSGFFLVKTVNKTKKEEK